MKVLYFDCFSGISGDMTVGALLDLGVDEALFKRELQSLNLDGYEITIEKTVKNAITGTNFHVILNQLRPAHTHRNLQDIETILDSSLLKPKVKELSKKIFREIARAEAKVHNKAISEIHFHEVGAIDSIVDIVGTAICIDLLGVRKIYASPLHDGCGYIQSQHGILPVPVPAVMEMLAESKIPLVSENINTELVTPTGMGIIKCTACDFGNMPAMMIDRIGYGFGKKDTGRLNALRVVLGTLFEQNGIMEEVALLETNIDNMSPEILGFTIEKLLASGALDAFYTPVYMKKNRPAYQLTVLAGKEKAENLVDIIFRETSTLGVRRSMTGRYCMHREMVRVNTDYGVVRVKVASMGEIKKHAPEYEDCREIAARCGLPLREVYDLVNEHYARGDMVSG